MWPFSSKNKKQKEERILKFQRVFDLVDGIEINEVTKKLCAITVKPGFRIIHKSEFFEKSLTTVSSGKDCIPHKDYGHFAIELPNGKMEFLNLYKEVGYYGSNPPRIYAFICDGMNEEKTTTTRNLDVVFLGAIHTSSGYLGDEFMRQARIIAEKYFSTPELTEDEKKILATKEEEERKIAEAQALKNKQKEEERARKADEKRIAEQRAHEKWKLDAENCALFEKLSIEREAAVEKAKNDALIKVMEAEAEAKRIKIEADALAYKLNIQNEALEREKALTLEILQMREKIEAQDLKGTADTTSLLLGLLKSEK